MIKASELRIGNLLMDVEDRICKVERIYEDDWTAYAIKGAATTGTPYPIPLTEEILLKVGFVSDELNGSFETFENGLKFTIIDKCGAWMIYLSGPFGMIVLKHIKFVHELQNLFNSLTGQELNTAGLI